MTEYTPEKVAELVAEAQNFRHQTQTPTESVNPNSIVGLWLRTADALTAVTAERDTAIRDLDAGFAESDHLSAKYYQRMRDAERDRDYMVINAQGLSRSGEQLKAERDRLHKAITEALELHQAKKIRESDRAYTLICSHCELRAYPCESARILRAALDKEGNDES